MILIISNQSSLDIWYLLVVSIATSEIIAEKLPAIAASKNVPDRCICSPLLIVQGCSIEVKSNNKLSAQLRSSRRKNYDLERSMRKELEVANNNSLNVKTYKFGPSGSNFGWKMSRFLYHLCSGADKNKNKTKKGELHWSIYKRNLQMQSRRWRRTISINQLSTCEPCSISDLYEFNEKARRWVKL